MNLKAIIAASALVATPLVAQHTQVSRFPVNNSAEHSAPNVIHPHQALHLPIHMHSKRLTNARNFPYEEREVILEREYKYAKFGLGFGVETEPHERHEANHSVNTYIVNHPFFVVTLGVHR